MTAKEYLQQIHMIQAKVKRLECVRAALRSDQYSVKSAAASLGSVRVQSDFTNSRVNRILCKIEAIDGSILKEIDQLQDVRQTIVNQIEMVSDERLREILFQRYVRCEKWEEISRNIYSDIRHVFRLHNQALEVFSEMFGIALSDGFDDVDGGNKTDDLKTMTQQGGWMQET